ncbi:MAG: radical SAM protein [Candidatus Thorarchaeota archaeon]|nr:radical SAM protein [Candidatus Thorarchaeota archaeon]
MVKRVRLSYGTAVQLGLSNGSQDPCFSTAFLMTYRGQKCDANCAFCPQANQSTSSSDRLSRISWPVFDLKTVLDGWPQGRSFQRICIQCLNYDQVVDDVVFLLERMRDISKLPISVSIHPVSSIDMKRLRDSGATNIGIAIDACTPALFDEIKGTKRGQLYRWSTHLKAIEDALQIFGTGNVTTHLIIGLGETEAEAVEFLFDMYSQNVNVGLFAFTAIPGTSLASREQPDLGSYRRIQVVRYLIANGKLNRNQVSEDSTGKISLEMGIEELETLLKSGIAFQTTGCKGCNRPFYNESPRGPIYNYPRPLTESEIGKSIQDTKLVI